MSPRKVSLLFLAAAVGVGVLAKATYILAPSWDQHVVIGVWSLVVGIIVFGISIAETWSKSGLNDRAGKCLIALINTGMLFLTAAGADAVVTPGDQ